MEAKTKDLWVFVETNEDGTAKNVGIELLTPGKMMAGKQGGALVAVVIGNNVDAAAKAALKAAEMEAKLAAMDPEKAAKVRAALAAKAARDKQKKEA